MESLHIIFGGASVEHDVSIITALQTYNALKEKYNITLIYCSKDNKLYITNKTLPEDYIEKDNLVKKLKEITIFNTGVYKVCKNKLKFLHKIKLILNCCHGGMGEDGRLNALFEFNSIPYTNSSTLPSAICMDKEFAKLVAKSLDIPIVDYFVVNKYSQNLTQAKKLGENLIVKPCGLGSSIGVVKCRQEKLKENIDIILHFDNKVLIEREISPLIEYNCAVVADGENIILSQIEQPLNKSDILSFEDKYISSEQMRILPAELDEDISSKIYDYSKKIYQHLDLNGVVRIDFLYDKNENMLYFNEANTIPGSLAYYLFEGLGISYIKFMEILIKNAKLNTLQPYFSTNILENLKNIGK